MSEYPDFSQNVDLYFVNALYEEKVQTDERFRKMTKQ